MVEEEVVKQEVNMVDQASINAERLEKANEVMKEQLKKLEEIESRRILGGRSAVETTKQTQEETPQEYAKRIMRGGI